MYNEINGTLMGNNLAYIFVYANQVTHDWFAFLMVIGFALIVLIGSSFMQLRYRATIRIETSVLVSAFATLGFAIILEQYSGILSPIYFIVIITLLILAFIWNAISD